MRYRFLSAKFGLALAVLLCSFLAGACQSSPNTATPPRPTVAEAVQGSGTPPGATATLASSVITPTMAATVSPSLTETPAAARPRLQSITGVEFSNNAAGNAQVAADLGAHWMRRNALLWSEVEALPGSFDWSKVAGLEEELKAANSQGLQVILIVRSTPPWAQKYPGVYCGPVKAGQLEAFAAFMKEVVARYSVPPFNVKYWELGNEPDVDYRQVSPKSEYGCWGDSGDADFGGGYYAQMLRVVYPQIKSADPQAHVLIGGLLLDCNPDNPPTNASGQAKDCSSGRFLEGILKAGGQEFFDGVSFHSYDYFSQKIGLGAYGSGNWFNTWNTTGPVLNPKSNFIRDLLEGYHASGKELVSSELALLCPSQNEQDCNTQDFNLTKAYYAAQSYASAQAQGLMAVIWYSDPSWKASGLVDRQNQPLPVYRAIQVSSRAIGQAGFVKEITQFPGVKGYEFQRASTSVWIMWSLDGKDHALNLPQKPQTAYDALGENLSAVGPLTVGLKPVYLEFNAMQ
jgi:hypothetical protein